MTAAQVNKVEVMTSFHTRDGSAFNRREQAEEHDRFLDVKEALYRVAGPRYATNYDGPASSWVPSAECLFQNRAVLRNMLLDLPEPPPQVIMKVETEYAFPHWTVPFVILAIGVAIGHFLL